MISKNGIGSLINGTQPHGGDGTHKIPAPPENWTRAVLCLLSDDPQVNAVSCYTWRFRPVRHLMSFVQKTCVALGGLVLLFILGCGEAPPAPSDAGSDGATAVVVSGLSPLRTTEDPTLQAWTGEQLTNAATAELKRIRDGLVEPDVSIDDGPTVAVRAPAIGDAGSVYREGSLSVTRPRTEGSETPAERRIAVGRYFDGLHDSLRVPEGTPIRIKPKIYRITVRDAQFDTRVRWTFYAQSDTVSSQRTEEWQVTWKSPATRGGRPQMLSAEILERERVFFESKSGPLFGDVTETVTAALEDSVSQFEIGVDRWASVISQFDFMTLLGHSGIAVGDVNGDGLDDVYISEEGGLPNRLWVQQPDGSIRDLSSVAGVDWLDATFGSLLVDLDGDGDQDLAAATYPQLVLAENDGQGRFTVRQRATWVEQAYSLSAADYDNDGDLDLYLATYGGSGTGSAGAIDADGAVATTSAPFPYHDAQNGGANVLLQNDGSFGFKDVTLTTGLDAHNRRFSFASAWNDYDRDGNVDLYVANDFGRNSLYRNEGGRFVDVAKVAGVEDIGTGMSVAWGDYDRDGRPDLYVGNMFSSAGNRVARQAQFAEQHTPVAAEHLLRTARGNSLFANAGDGTFRDVTLEAAVDRGLWAWSSRFGDLNNDGWEDIVVCNGFVTGDDTGDL